MLKGKKVLITGAGRGIGARIAEVLAESGCSLALCARTEAEVEDTAAKLSHEYDIPAFPYVCDVSRWDEVEKMVVKAEDDLGGIEVLVNNAAVPGPLELLEDADIDEWRQAIEVNLFGAVHCCRAVIPIMKRQRGGKIINLSGAGVGWKEFGPKKTAYISSKFAAYGFTEALAGEVEGDNIQVNALSPGSVHTKLRSELLTREQDQAARRNEEALSPDPAAKMAAFLASDRSAGLTGKIISANWDDPDELASKIGELNGGCQNTLRKIDGRNYSRLFK